MSMYTTRFTVAGAGEFPLDMLRYDGCYPATSGDVAQMVDRFARERRKVQLFTSHPTKAQNGLTPDRWRSFGWQVVEIEQPV